MDENVSIITKNEIIDDQKITEDQNLIDELKKFTEDQNLIDELKKFTEEEEAVWEELLIDVIWEFALDVHRLIKLDALFLDPDLDPYFHSESEEDTEEQEEIEKDASGQKIKKTFENNLVTCPQCNKEVPVTGYGTHLLKCMGGVPGSGRNSSREASKKMAADDENEFDVSPSTSSFRRRHKKMLGRKTFRSKFRENNMKYYKQILHFLNLKKEQLENTTTKHHFQVENCYPLKLYTEESTDDFENMSFEEKELFFQEKCGVIDDLNKRCENSFNCTQHTDEEKELTRRNQLSIFDDDSSGEFDNDLADDSGFFVI